MNTLDPRIRRWDIAMAFSFYATAFFIPIAPAITEGLFAVIIFSFIFKRITIFNFDRAKNKSLLKCFKPVESPLNKPLSFYVLIAFLSVLINGNFAVGFKGLVFKLLQGIFTYFLFIETINNKKRLKIFLSVLLISFSIITIDGIFQYFFRKDFVHFYPVTDGRITASFKHANDFAAYLVMLIPLTFTLSKLFSYFNGTKQGNKRIFELMTVLFIFAIICLGVTFSRSAWISFTVSMLFLSLRKRKLIIPVLIFILSFAVIFTFKMIKERKSNINVGILTASDRFVYWKSALTIIKDHPLAGVGLNAYSDVAKDYPKELGWRGYPHNCYLHIAAELGIPGLLIFLWIIFIVYKETFLTLKTIGYESTGRILLGLISGFTGFLIHSFFDTSFYSVSLETLMWLMIGFIMSINLLKSSINNIY